MQERRQYQREHQIRADFVARSPPRKLNVPIADFAAIPGKYHLENPIQKFHRHQRRGGDRGSGTSTSDRFAAHFRSGTQSPEVAGCGVK